jgi:hypothetical protein
MEEFVVLARKKRICVPRSMEGLRKREEKGQHQS